MRPSFYIALVAGLFSFFSSTAQVAVRIIDEEERNPLAFAHVLRYDLTGKRVEAFVTNASGEVMIQERPSRSNPLIIELKYLGYETQRDTLVSNNAVTYMLAPSDIYLNEVVITAQYGQASAEQSVHKVKVIDEQKIQKMAAVNLEDVLTNEVNIRISQDAVLGSGVSMQGLSGQNVKIMIDGVPVIGRQNGNIDLRQINLNDVERIEIIEGPLSVNYGTDALAGTINIITKKTSSDKTSLQVSSYNETVGRYNLNASLNQQIGPLRASLSGGRNFFNGWAPNDRIEPNSEQPVADTTRVKPWDPRMQYFGRAQLSLVQTKHRFTWRSELFDERIDNRGMPRAPYFEQAFDDVYITRRSDHALSVSGQFSTALSYQAVAGYNTFERISNTYRTDLTTLERQLTTVPGDQDTALAQQWMSRASLVHTLIPTQLTWEIGYDVNRETAVGARIEDGRQVMGDYAAFATAEWSPNEHFTLRPGLRYAYNTAYDAPLTPSLNIRYAIKDWVIRSSYARGFRAPGLKELYFTFVDINHNIVGNTALEAEYSHNFNASAKYKHLFKQTLVQWEASGFYNSIENQITLGLVDQATQEYSYINVGRTQTMGLNTSAGLVLEHLKWNAAVALIGLRNAFAVEEEVGFSYYPEVTSNLTYTWQRTGLEASLFYKYQGRLPQVQLDANGEPFTGFIDAYHTLDANLARDLMDDRFRLSLGAKNLFNVQNVAMLGAGGGAHGGGGNAALVGMGRIYFLKLDFKWTR
mgnify:CR=1 FL=1